MDFGTLLHVAQKKVVETTQKDVKYLVTKFGPPKKEEREKKLSANVQRFLARKEAEEKQKAEEARIKKLQLLELRAQDGKAKKRIASMLQRTKSANKSVIDDAIDNRNTAVTMAGPSQPDEDDYGYESQESALIYAKMMERYSAMPEEEKFPGSKKRAVSTNLSSTKERVKAALLREEEEANMPHKRKRRSKHDDSDPTSGSRPEPMTYNSQYDERDEEPPQEKPKPKRPPPPPLNFNDLLKIAEKKQFEPIVIEPKKVKEDEPLLTKKQKREAEKEKAWRESREARLRAALTAPQKPKPAPSSGQDKSLMPPPNKIPKLNSDRKGLPPTSNGTIPKIPKNGEIRSSPKTPSQQPIKSDPNRIPKKVTSENRSPLSQNKILTKSPSNSKPEKRPESRERQYLPGDIRAKQQTQPESKPKQYLPGDSRASQQPQSEPKRQYLPGDLRAKQQQPSESKSKQYLPGDLRAKQQQPSQNEPKPRQYLPGDVRAKQQSKQPESSNNRMSQPQSKPKMNGTTPSSTLKPKQFPPADVRPPLSKQNPQGLKPKQFPPADLKPKQFPPADLKPRQFPPPDVRGRFPPKDVKRKPKRPIIEDEDSEYDSELDDFIDDGPQGDEEDYSKHIREIFGYDKSKYRYVDDDDDAAMESKFSTIMKEEYLSTKIGIMEDLEDIRKEAEEKKRKAIMKKKMKR